MLRSRVARLPFAMALLNAMSTPAPAALTGPQQQQAELVASNARPLSLRSGFERMRGVAGDTTIRALDDNATAWAARWRLMAEAQRSIDTSYFIVDGDLFGFAFIAHLYVRASEGVRVNLLLDGRGSGSLALPFGGLDELQELVATGNADVHIYNPPVLQLARTVLERSAVPVSAGTHTKILVADDAVAITGGRNIGAVYFTTREENAAAAVDFDIEIEGGAPLAALDDVMHHEFSRWGEERVRRDAVNLDNRADFLRILYFAMDAWLRGEIPAAAAPAEAAVLLEAAALSRLETLPPPPARDEARVYLAELASLRSLRGTLPPAGAAAATAAAAGPATATVEARLIASRARDEKPDDTVNDAIIQAVACANERIWIQSPYFLLTPRLLAALTRASARGVEIVALTNGPNSSDNMAAQAIFIDTWPELQARMPTLRVFVGAQQMLHTKRVIVDDELTLVGSHNLDPLSTHLNSEVVVAVWSRALNADARARFQATLAGGGVLEYRIKRERDGSAARGADDRVLVAFGPEHHLPRRQLQELRALKELLFSVRGIWDFEFVAW